MNMPHEPLLDITFCRLGPTSIFAEWLTDEGTLGLWKRSMGEQPLDVKTVIEQEKQAQRHGHFHDRSPSLDLLIEMKGPFLLMWKPRHGGWQKFVISDKKTLEPHTCFAVASVSVDYGRQRKYVFLLEAADKSIHEVTPLKLRRFFAPVAPVLQKALG